MEDFVKLSIYDPQLACVKTLETSKNVPIASIKKIVSKQAAAAHVTNYHFECDGERVNSNGLLSDVETQDNDLSFVIMEDNYSGHSARVHVDRLEQIIEEGSSNNGSVFLNISKTSVEDESDPLLDIYPSVKPEKCVEIISYSGWNPPPSYRKLSGDLFYLEITLCEGQSIHITVWTKGFYINKTNENRFNPEPVDDKPCHNHSLVGLLSEYSELFSERYTQLITGLFERSSLYNDSITLPRYPWLTVQDDHVPNPQRAGKFLKHNHETEFLLQGKERDWNQLIQNSRDAPKTDVNDRMNRDKQTYEIYSKFVEAAIKGAVEVINGNIPPIDSGDNKKTQMFIFNHIFYSFSMDGRGLFEDCGGDTAAFKSASNDLLGVKDFNFADIDGLYTLGTVLVDYRGYRVLAQSIIKGLFEEEQENNMDIVYGSLDGEHIKADEEFHRLLLQAANKLNIKPHLVKGIQDTESVEIATHAEIKGIVGTCGRHFILDLYGTTPRDLNFVGQNDLQCIVRRELINSYVSKLAAEQDTEDVSQFNFNTDLYTNTETEEVEEDVAELKNLANYLLETVERFCEGVIDGDCSPVDGESLCLMLHQQGINFRYLGKIAGLLEGKNDLVHNICVSEMISRAIKHLLSKVLRETDNQQMAYAIQEFLSCYFVEIETSTISYTYATLEESIRALIKDHYKYELPETLPKDLPILRAICKRSGIQLKARNYNLSDAPAILVEDIVTLFPNVKHSLPSSQECEVLVNAGNTLIKRNQIDVAFGLMNQAKDVISHVYGEVHSEMAKCYRGLAEIYQRSNNMEEAYNYQEKALIITERTLGIDHFQTGADYLQLAKLGSKELTDSIVKYVNRSLLISRLITGPNPSISDSFLFLSKYFESNGQEDDALDALEKALANSIDIHTEDHPINIQYYQLIAEMYSKNKNEEEVLKYLQIIYTLANKHFGSDNELTTSTQVKIQQINNKNSAKTNVVGSGPDLSDTMRSIEIAKAAMKNNGW
eukprot:TRINITY_DN752_c0_g1_i1.p1 TRINITY_DN752_c0_g1~~TRINITY_DN752_c0_g1_i1.p1  ORF type:complete len:998 (-),score=257.44 TRINITY_DN752_c0_g1_i1:85-3078(-)